MAQRKCIYWCEQEQNSLELNQLTKATDASTDSGSSSSSTPHHHYPVSTWTTTPSARHHQQQPCGIHGTPRYQQPYALRCPNHTITLVPRPQAGLLYTSTEGAGIFGVLGDFDLLDLLAQRGTVAGSVLADNTDLLGALGLEMRRLDGWIGNRWVYH